MVRSWTAWWVLVAIGGASCGDDDVQSSGGSSETTEAQGSDDDGPAPTTSSSSDGDDPDTSSGDGTTTSDTTSDTTDTSADTTAGTSSSDTSSSDTSSSDTSASETSSGDSSSDSDASSSSSGGECGLFDECADDEDCMPGQTCIACICLGEPISCDEYGDGVFADCTAGDNTVCENPAAGCLVDDIVSPTGGVCFFPCEETCDCPVPPPGFEDSLACDDLTGEGDGDCYIDCAGGLACPDDMFCFANTICFVGEEPPGTPTYGDCQNLQGPCEAGVCLQGPSDYAVCSEPCGDVGDCPPAPDTGDAPVACADLTLDMMGDCFLDCSGGQTCPDGMMCDPDGFGVCVWAEL